MHNLGQSISSFFRSLLRYVLVGFFFVLSLPGAALRGIFFAVDIDQDGNIVRSRFSITRAAFTLSTGLMLFRIASASIDIDRIEYGKPCIEKKTIKKGKRRPASRPKKKKTASITVKGYKGKPLAWTEIWMYVVLVALYYFHRDINRGSEEGMLKQVIQVLVEAQALKQGINLHPQGPPSTTETVSLEKPVSKIERGEKAKEVPKEKDPFS